MFPAHTTMIGGIAVIVGITIMAVGVVLEMRKEK